MYERVLVPLDGSRLAEGILPFILQIARPLDLEVVLIYVVRPVAPQAIEGTRHFTVDDVAARLKEAREYPRWPPICEQGGGRFRRRQRRI